MKRTTLSLPPEVAYLLEREARRRGVSASAVAREALTEHFGLQRDKPREIPFAKLGYSGYRDTARRFEEYLAEARSRAGDR